jgi:hypothetical protein
MDISTRAIHPTDMNLPRLPTQCGSPHAVAAAGVSARGSQAVAASRLTVLTADVTDANGLARAAGFAPSGCEARGVSNLSGPLGRGPHRASARKKWKIQTKSPMCKKRSKSFS